MMESQDPMANMATSRNLESTKATVIDGRSHNEEVHEFSEQTNYVPKRAIITVSL
jgi:hypothetical protein